MVFILYSWRFSKTAQTELEKIPKDVQARIIDKLDKCKIKPFRFFMRLKGRKDYKLRVGEYRVIADIYPKELQIDVTKVGHRKNIYKD